MEPATKEFADYILGELRGDEVQLPRHLFIPKGAEVVNFARLVNVPAGTVNQVIWEHTAKSSEFFTFVKYAIFNEGLIASQFSFYPTIANKRILRYHGDPEDNFRLALSTGTDLSETSLVQCNEILRPNSTIQWRVTNNSAAPVRMGVRMLGYLENQYKGEL